MKNRNAQRIPENFRQAREINAVLNVSNFSHPRIEQKGVRQSHNPILFIAFVAESPNYNPALASVSIRGVSPFWFRGKKQKKNTLGNQTIR